MPKKGPTPRRATPKQPEWTPFRYARDVPSPLGGHAKEPMWENSRYVVIVALHDEPAFPGGKTVHLSIRRQDREDGPFPWRDLQRIKSELAGSEAEGVEVFPASSRLLDAANQRHMFCTMPGEHFAFGFDNGRQVQDDAGMRLELAKPESQEFLRSRGISEEKILSGGKQADFDGGIDYDLGHDGLIWRTTG